MSDTAHHGSAASWSPLRRAVADKKLLFVALDALESAGCIFQFCEGPTPRPKAMVTCNVCDVIGRLRRRLGLPIRDGVEGAVPIKAARYAADMERATSPGSTDGSTTIVSSFVDNRRWVGVR